MSSPKNFLLITVALSLSILATEPPVRHGWITRERLLRADAEPGNWFFSGRDFREQHYSPLAQINDKNIQTLGFAWQYDAGVRRGRVQRGLEATPTVVDGIMYAAGAWGVVYALDARTGNERWRYDPVVDGSYGRRACCDVVNRGLQVWEGRVYVATLDGYLVALDARTGRELWKADTFTDRKRSYTITSAPHIAGDKIVIGNSGGEFGVRGYISAYDARTGKFAWRFFTVPGDPEKGYEHPEMELAAKTWDPNSAWEAGGGGTVWGAMVYDPELNLLYVGTGNSSPYPIWHRSPKGGDNLFLTSILAINPDNGRMKWYYQTTPGEIWDYTATQNMILAELPIDGRTRKVLMQAPKNGFFYVLDRETGQFISAEKFVQVTWASHVDKATGRPVLTGQGNYKDEPKLVFPGMAGGHNWQPMSYSPKTRLVYIPAIDFPFLYFNQPTFTYKPGDFNMGADAATPPFRAEHQPYLKGQPPADVREQLKAWDPVRQQVVWSVPNPGLWNGGILSTAGNLVFQGTSAGKLMVYRADNGEKLHEIPTGTGIMAAPMTYTVGKKQYVAVMAGLGGAWQSNVKAGTIAAEYQNLGRILVFELGGKPVPFPPKQPPLAAIPEPPPFTASAEDIKKGKDLYYTHCVHCHNEVVRDNTTGYPNLVYLTPETHRLFKQIVLHGLLKDGGMAGFSDLLSDGDADAIQSYIASRQREERQKMLSDKKR
ncbi:PQQ-dependent methanol/ethanol family dehydrogenase [Nibrella viscosa]|uniref:PQQ-dependent methanol/ethanol family dehydrogenase n=1 Tax=Nibrella viscosa TaxID=1084524 RepID=A0ABP8K6I2_9BACT